ncbi:helix-turn-helix domain-containing protein [Alteribacillus sp. JSM 102045]|uniref:helix-turn-helix domain-containing protein n=1 Tax=Alteribacillus sp. JSM 102045 TaxID=1562101 RepID=UPI0035C03ACF
MDKGRSSIKEIIEHYQISLSTFKDWRRKYNHLGLEALQSSKSWIPLFERSKITGSLREVFSGGGYHSFRDIQSVGFAKVDKAV